MENNVTEVLQKAQLARRAHLVNSFVKGNYMDTAKNRKLGRVGQEYGKMEPKKEKEAKNLIREAGYNPESLEDVKKYFYLEDFHDNTTNIDLKVGENVVQMVHSGRGGLLRINGKWDSGKDIKKIGEKNEDSSEVAERKEFLTRAKDKYNKLQKKVLTSENPSKRLLEETDKARKEYEEMQSENKSSKKEDKEVGQPEEKEVLALKRGDIINFKSDLNLKNIGNQKGDRKVAGKSIEIISSNDSSIMFNIRGYRLAIPRRKLIEQKDLSFTISKKEDK